MRRQQRRKKAVSIEAGRRKKGCGKNFALSTVLK
jgi:hypothetical protein